MFVCVSASFFSFSYFLSVHYLLHRFPGAVDGASPAIQVHWHAAELAYLKRYRNMYRSIVKTPSEARTHYEFHCRLHQF